MAFINQNLTVISFSIALLALVLVLVSLFLFFRINKSTRGIAAFLTGKNGTDLEAAILEQAKEIKNLDKEIQEIYDISNKIHAMVTKSIQKIGVIRFNPFKDIGGDQSFAIALLDSKNSGVVISSLHTKEGTRIYSKPILSGESKKYPLTEEEKQAIKIASPLKESKV